MASRSVRLKFDPRDDAHKEFVDAQGYEGWVLEEDPGSGDMSVFVADLGNLLSIPATATEYDGETLDLFKSYIIDVILDDNKVEEQSPEIDQITRCKNTYEIENVLKGFGYGDHELVDLYRRFIEAKF